MSPLLEVRELTHAFGGLTAVRGLDLRIQEGEIQGIIGPNGSGKTTTFNLITGIHRPDAGRIRLDGLDITGAKPFAINRAGIARTFQNLRVFTSLTVLDHVRIAHHRAAQTGLFQSILRLERAQAQEAALRRESMDLLDLLHLAGRSGARAAELSYGELRRLEIARALATRPRLILLDEPAAGMNPAEVNDLMRLILRIRDEFKVAVLLIEHHMKFVMGLCGEVLVMDFGEVIARGEPASVVREAKVLQAYLGRKAAPC